MHIDEIRQLIHAEPFHPFLIHLEDGRKLRVKHPDYIATSPSGRTVVVFENRNGADIIDVPLIVSVQVEPGLPDSLTSKGLAS